jgi:beta-1,4-mannosyl-glycoprotein beta-1,4-N-acetylglucosaminyltransferase
MFFNELECLEIRLHELSDVVDRFILVESPITHSGKAKPLYYQENKHLFEEFNSRIDHIIYTPPDTNNAWVRERLQRDAIREGCNLSEGDFLIVSDADEIPSAESIKAYNPKQGFSYFYQHLFYFYLNTYSCGWGGPKIIPNERFQRGESLTALRSAWCEPVPCDRAGWHFSYLGGKERVLQKIASFAHVEMNVEKNRKLVDGWICDARLWNNQQLEIKPIDSLFPQYVFDNQDKFTHLIKYHENHRIFNKTT